MYLANGARMRAVKILGDSVDLCSQYYDWRLHIPGIRFIASLDVNLALLDKDHRAAKGVMKAIHAAVYKGGLVILLTQNDGVSTRYYMTENDIDISWLPLRGLMCGAVMELSIGDVCKQYTLVPDERIAQVSAQMASVRDSVQQFCANHNLLYLDRHHPMDVSIWTPPAQYNGIVGVEGTRLTDFSLDARLRNGSDLQICGYLVNCLGAVARRTLDQQGVRLKGDSVVRADRGFMSLNADIATKAGFLAVLQAVARQRGIMVGHFGDGESDLEATDVHGVFVGAPEGTYCARNGAHQVFGPPGQGANDFLNYMAVQYGR